MNVKSILYMLIITSSRDLYRTIFHLMEVSKLFLVSITCYFSILFRTGHLKFTMINLKNENKFFREKTSCLKTLKFEWYFTTDQIITHTEVLNELQDRLYREKKIILSSTFQNRPIKKMTMTWLKIYFLI